MGIKTQAMNKVEARAAKALADKEVNKNNAAIAARLSDECRQDAPTIGDLDDVTNDGVAGVKSRKFYTQQRVVTDIKNEILNNVGGVILLNGPAKKVLPTLLCRLPIFMAQSAKKQKAMLDKNFAIPFETSFGKGFRYGPPLTVFDERVLGALIGLSDIQYYGDSSKAVIPSAGPVTDNAKAAPLRCLVTSSKNILEFMGLSDAGKNYAKIVQSVTNLAACKLSLTLTKPLNETGKNPEDHGGVTFDLMNIEWRNEHNDHTFVVQFSSVLTHCLGERYTYIDWNIFNSVPGSNSKVIYAFLATQRPFYAAKSDAIGKNLLLDCEPNKVFNTICTTLDFLEKEHGWCSYFVTGTGRAIPKMFHITIHGGSGKAASSKAVELN